MQGNETAVGTKISDMEPTAGRVTDPRKFKYCLSGTPNLQKRIWQASANVLNSCPLCSRGLGGVNDKRGVQSSKKDIGTPADPYPICRDIFPIEIHKD